MVAPSVRIDQIGPVDNNPVDWPADGPIDLAVHDRPHASSTIEWWYVNGHCTTTIGQRFSLFVAFFRQASGRDPKTKAFEYVHSLAWALYDVDAGETHTVSRFDSHAPSEALKRLQRGLGSNDERLNRAMSEVLSKGRVPFPDALLPGPVYVDTGRLDLVYATDSLRRLDDGRYALRLHEPAAAFGCDVILTPLKAAVRHGDNGVVRGSNDERMFYYFVPRNRLTGTIELRGQRFEIAEGSAWYNHEFGVGEIEDVDDVAEARLSAEERALVHARRKTVYEQRQVGWEWLSVQLENGTDVSVYALAYTCGGRSAGNWSVICSPEGDASTHTDALLTPLETWRSYQTFSTYPVRWRMQAPSAGMDLDVEAAFPDQEFVTLISKPSFWEGRVHVKGTLRGKPVSGVGFIERSGFTSYNDLDGFFEQVGEVVRKSVSEVVPIHPDYEAARKLIATKDDDRYMRGVDIEQYARAHLAPIREIVDRGGKGWRSYAAITCCDIVGGDSRHFIQWLAMPELMHVGSLIVDDVQDRSTTRRGKPTAHLLYGEPQAINSGTAAYFLIWPLIQSERLSDRDKRRIYDEYFYAMRAGHAGQAIDLDGFDDLMEEVVKTGDSRLLIERVLAVHRLKTGAPAGCLARMGAIGGGGSDAQVKALGLFFEDLGLAFQIIDDVLNLRGFKDNLKARAEDVRQGKVTLPVAEAMGRLGPEERRFLRDGLSAKSEDHGFVMAIVDLLEGCGAIEACAVTARELVEKGWAQLDPLVEDSIAKVMLRAFGWYLLDRHY